MNVLRKAKLWIILIVLGLFAGLFVQIALAAPIPTVTLDLPAENFIGEDFSFTVTFDNTSSADVGYGPFIDVVFPVTGADGDDGIDFVSATYLGLPVTTVQLTFPAPGGCVDHPYAVDNTGSPVQVCGTPGDKLVVLQLPFGSFTNDQPPATVTINATLSNLADLSSPLTVTARAGFQFGADPLDNPTTDPSILSQISTDSSTWSPSAALTPTLIALTKTYSGPEDETATGPNYPRRYTVTADIATGQTITDFVLSDLLPNNLAFLSLVSAKPAGYTVVQTPTVGAPSNPPTNALAVLWPSITGGAGDSDATFTFEYFVPRADADGDPVINADTGDDALSVDDARAQGTWTPIDARDPATFVSSDITPNDHTLNDRSIAIQKGVAVAVDTGSPGPTPGDILEYTLDFQISDFFAFQGIVITDTFSDGQHWLETYTPTLTVSGNGFTLTTSFSPTNYTVAPNYTPADPAPNDGTTTVYFRVSDELIAHGYNGRLVGGCVPPDGTGGPLPDCQTYNDGPTTAVITFRTTILEDFTDTYPSGDPSVDQGDVLTNTVTVDGQVLNVANLAPTGYSEADGSGASISLPRGELTKTIYAVNGVVCSPQPCTDVKVAPGYTLTYRFQYTLPASDVEDLEFADYLPLPVLYASEVVTFNASATVPPPAGTATYGISDTFHLRPGAPTPTLITDTVANRIRFIYGDYDDPTDTPSMVDILFTVTASADPFADGLYLTNQVRESEGSTNAGSAVQDAIVQFQLTEPVLRIRKGVVATDNPAGLFSPAGQLPENVSISPPGSSCPRLSGSGLPVSSTNLGTTFNSNLSNVDGGDQVTFAIVIENVGSGLTGAFDIRIRDTLPTGFITPTGGLNLCITDGTGATIGYSNIGGGLFDPAGGIELTDPGPTSDPAGALDPYDPNNGRNIAIILYDLQVDTGARPAQAIVNTATLFNYAGIEGGPDHTTTDRENTATVTIASPAMSKGIVATNQAHTTGTSVAIGEIITYSVVITVPEGTSPSATLTDVLDQGLAFVGCDNVTASPGLTTTIGAFSNACNPPTNPTVGPEPPGNGEPVNQGRRVTFDFGTVTNSNADNSVAEAITVTYRVVVVNSSGVVRGSALNNAATWAWSDGSTDAAAPNVTVVEPTMQVSKSASPTTGDAGDVITFTLTIQHTSASNADAFNLTLTDTIPAGMTYVPGSLDCTPGTQDPTTCIEAGGTITATWDTFLDNGTNAIIRFRVTLDSNVTPGQQFVNTGNIRWTGLPGDITIPQSPYNTLSTERTGNTSDPGGAANNYRASGSATVTVFSLSPTKSIVATSEAHTGSVAGTERVAIGEIVRYRLAVRLPEGAAANFQLLDTIPNGLRFLNDNTAKVAFVANGAGISSTTITTTLPGCSGLNIIGNSSVVTPTCPLPDEAVSASATTNNDTYNDGTDVYFKLGDLTNADSDEDQEFIVVEFNALVDNISNNQAFNNATGGSSATTRSNNFTVRIAGSQVGSASNPVSVRIAEPVIRDLTKTVITAPSDAGDTLVYRLTYSNSAGGNDAAAAFDIVLTDTLNSYLTFQSITGTTTSSNCGDTPSTFSGGAVGQVVTGTVSCLNPGASATIIITARVNADAPAGWTIPNTATLTYTSLPGPNGTVSNPTGSSTPGSSGSATGERDGSNGVGGLNDYVSSSRAVTTTLSTPTIDKLEVSPAQYTIGQVVTYSIVVTLPEGLTRDLVVFDDIPVGMAYVSHQVIATAVGSGGLLTEDFAGTLPTPTVSAPGGNGNDLTLTFGDTITTDDNDPDNNRFLVRLAAVVLNVLTNQDGTALTNQATVRYTNPNTNNTVNVNDPTPPTITVIEPVLALSKSILGMPSPPDAGGVITYQVVISHDAASHAPAYDVVMTDTVPGGLTNPAIVGVSANGITPPSAEVSGGQWRVPNTADGTFDLPQGAVVTVTIQAELDSNVTPGQRITNTAVLTWSSLDGTVAEERHSGDGLLNSGGLNDYEVHASVGFDISGIALAKALEGTSAAHTAGSDVTIGEIITYSLTTTLPEGTTPGLVVTDSLPSGLAYVTGTATVDTSGFAGTVPTPTVTGGAGDGDDVILTFGTITVTNDNNPANNSFIVRLQARVLDVPGNVGTNPPGQTSLPNSATATVVSGPSATSNTVTATVVEPGLLITKRFIPEQAAANDTLTVTLVVTNTGTSDAFDVIVEDPLPQAKWTAISEGSTPAGFSFAVVSAPPTSTVRYSGGTVMAGQTLTFAFQATLTSGVSAGEVLTNTATVTQATTLPGADPGERDEPDVNASATLTVTAPDIALAKDDSLTSLVPGQTTVYTLTVSNIGGRDATGVVVTDTVPAHMAFNAGNSDPGWSCVPDGNPGSTCTYTVGNLAAGSSVAIHFALSLDSPAPAGLDEVTNTAHAGDDGTHGTDPNLADNTSSDTDTVVAAPDLKITKDDGVITALPGQVLTYTLTIQNIGNQDATGVRATDTLPVHTSFLAASDGGTHSAGQVTWPPFNLGAGATITRSVTVQVDSLLPVGTTAITNTATVADDGANGPDPNPADNTASDTDTINAADLAITKADNPDPVSAGQPLTYTLTVTNNGPSDATDVTVTDTLPVSVTLVSATPAQGTCSGTAPVVCNLSGLAGGASTTITIVVTVETGAPDLLENHAEVHGDQPDVNSGNNTATAQTTVEHPAIGAAKAVAAVVNNNDGTFTVAYTITVRNYGDVALDNVQVTDNLATTFPAPTTFSVVSVASTGFTVNPGYNGSSDINLLAATGNTLTVGETKSITLTVTVTPTTSPATYNNQATAFGVSPAGTQVSDVSTVGTDPDDDGGDPGNDNDGNPMNNSDPTPVTLAQNPGIALVKTGPAASYVGGTAVYTYTVSNTGDVRLGTVAVTDDKCSPVTYVSGDTNGNGYLDVNETWLFTCTYTVQADDPNPLVNTATASGVGPLGQQMSDTDDWSTDLVTFSIGDTVWLDANDNGAPDAGEQRLYNVPVTISGTDIDGGAVNITVYTDVNGNYLVNLAKPGTYTVTAPATFMGFQLSWPASGSYDVTLSTAAPVNLNADFGYKQPTGVYVLNFRGSLAWPGVRLQWETVVPDGVPAPTFLLYRSIPAAASWEQLTAEPIAPAAMGGNILDYAFTDAGAQGGVIYWYQLVDPLAPEVVYGPYKVQIRQAYLPLLMR